MSQTRTHETYAEWLGRQMEERSLSRRALARAWRPDDPEIARRSIKRYLDGTVPHERTRVEIARALGSEETEPSSSDDDLEGSLLAVLQARVAEINALVEQVQRARAAA